MILCTNTILGQDRVLKIINTQNNNEKIVEEFSRIKLKTFSGVKKVGKFEIVDSSSVKIRGHYFKLSDVKIIKKYPLAFSIATKIVFIGGGLAIAVTGIYTPGGIAVLLFFTGGVVAYLGSESPNIFNKGHSVKSNWAFSIGL